ncbi:MAG: hypothetical protein ACYTGC_03765 [Planctomycetota bacterium]|jgi:hypothetical protein
MSKTRIVLSLIVVLLLATSARAGSSILLNEIRIDDPTADEYLELVGPASASLDDLTLIIIGDRPTPPRDGIIEEVIDLSGETLGPDGLFLIAADGDTFGAVADLIVSLNFEDGDNVTFVLVEDFSGALGDDLDTNDDGTLDVTPWTSVLDALGLLEEPNPPTGTEYAYGASLGFEDIGPDPDNGDAVPSHVFRCWPSADWYIGPFDGTGDDSLDTPGAVNAIACADDCVDAVTIFEGTTDFDTTFATTDGPEHRDCFAEGDQIHNDIWFAFEATCSGDLFVSTCDMADFDTRIAVYEDNGCPVTEDDLLECEDDNSCSGGTTELVVEVVAGEDYLIRVGGATGSDFGAGTLRVSFPAVLQLVFERQEDGFDPSDNATVQLTMSNLCGQTAIGFEAFLSFDTKKLEFKQGEYTDSPFGLHVLDPIEAVDGEIDLAALIDPMTQSPTSDDAILATLDFTDLRRGGRADPAARAHRSAGLRRRRQQRRRRERRRPGHRDPRVEHR